MITIESLQQKLTALTMDINQAIDRNDVNEYLRLTKERRQVYAELDIVRWQRQASSEPVAQEGGDPCAV